jgi:hypothetical protein
MASYGPVLVLSDTDSMRRLVGKIVARDVIETGLLTDLPLLCESDARVMDWLNDESFGIQFKDGDALIIGHRTFEFDSNNNNTWARVISDAEEAATTSTRGDDDDDAKEVRVSSAESVLVGHPQWLGIHVPYDEKLEPELACRVIENVLRAQTRWGNTFAMHGNVFGRICIDEMWRTFDADSKLHVEFVKDFVRRAKEVSVPEQAPLLKQYFEDVFPRMFDTVLLWTELSRESVPGPQLPMCDESMMMQRESLENYLRAFGFVLLSRSNIMSRHVGAFVWEAAGDTFPTLKRLMELPPPSPPPRDAEADITRRPLVVLSEVLGFCVHLMDHPFGATVDRWRVLEAARLLLRTLARQAHQPPEDQNNVKEMMRKAHSRLCWPAPNIKELAEASTALAKRKSSVRTVGDVLKFYIEDPEELKQFGERRIDGVPPEALAVSLRVAGNMFGLPVKFL